MTNLINLAASLMDGGDDLTLDEHGEVQHEYLRGMVELIIDAYGIAGDDGARSLITGEILRRTDLKVRRSPKQGVAS